MCDFPGSPNFLGSHTFILFAYTLPVLPNTAKKFAKLSGKIGHMLTCIPGQGHIEGQGHFLGHPTQYTFMGLISLYVMHVPHRTAIELYTASNCHGTCREHSVIHHNMLTGI